MTLLSRLASIALLGAICLPLGGCFGSDSAASNEPALPPVIYVITQYTEDGSKLMVTDFATSYYFYQEGRCISYVNPEDPSNADRRLICGGLVRIKPKDH